MGSNNLKLTFYGGAGVVTGANFLLESQRAKMLIDCGLLQGSTFATEENRKPFAYDPSCADFLAVTHAHVDHIGRIPKLVRDGFKGKIFSTPETKALSELMLEDALKITEEDAARNGILPFYERKDIEKAMSLWETLSYHTRQKLGEDFEIFFKDAGHVLGSAICEISTNGKKVVFTGDLGNSPSPILRDTEVVSDADFLVIESVYGDRNHEAALDRRNKMQAVMKRAFEKKGVLLIPSFSLEKTQVLLHEINFLVEHNLVPEMPVFLDSPLAIRVTEIYAKMRENLNDSVRKSFASGDDIFAFPKLRLTYSARESEDISRIPGPKVIIAGSGMSTGGRIMEHEKRYLSDRRNIILFVGYQTAGSLGRQISEGMTEVNIGGVPVEVNAEVFTIQGYSSHKDSEGLLDFVAKTAGTLKGVFVVMGEPKSSSFLAQRIRDYIVVENVVVPGAGESFEL